MNTTQATPFRRLCAALLGCGLLLSLSGCGSEPEAPARPRIVQAMKVATPDELLERSFPGRASAASEVNLSFRVAGPLISGPVDVGQRVQAGDVVARIDPRDFEVRLRTVEGQRERAKVAADYGLKEYERFKRIQDEDPGATSELAIDTAERQRDVARADLEAIESTVTAAADQLRYTQLVAPFDGTVVATYVENYEHVLPQQPILRLLNRSQVEFDISIPETLIGYAPYVEDILVTFDAFEGREFPATVKEIGEEATQATRTFPVTLVLDQPEGVEVLSGMAGDARITSRPPPDVEALGIPIPAGAVFSEGPSGDSFVWVVDPSTRTLLRRTVVARSLTGTGVSVESGLEAGEWILLAGVHTAREGQEVRVFDVTSGEEVTL